MQAITQGLSNLGFFAIEKSLQHCKFVTPSVTPKPLSAILAEANIS